MMGTIPMAREIARTRSSVCRYIPSALLQHIRGLGFAKPTDISEWRTHRRWRYAKHCLDGFACPAELSNDLLICHSCKGLIEKCHQQGVATTQRTETCMVGPGVYADLMASHVFLDQHRRTFNDARSNNEEGRKDIFRAKVIEEFPAVRSAQSPNAKLGKKKTD
jgi:hypothetical protein